MATPLVYVNYDGTDYGRIYIGDVGRRHQLGGGKGIYTIGQDRYLSYGEDATFIGTGDVYMSTDYAGYDRTGVIRHFEDVGAFTVTT